MELFVALTMSNYRRRNVYENVAARTNARVRGRHIVTNVQKSREGEMAIIWTQKPYNHTKDRWKNNKNMVQFNCRIYLATCKTTTKPWDSGKVSVHAFVKVVGVYMWTCNLCKVWKPLKKLYMPLCIYYVYIYIYSIKKVKRIIPPLLGRIKRIYFTGRMWIAVMHMGQQLIYRQHVGNDVKINLHSHKWLDSQNKRKRKSIYCRQIYLQYLLRWSV